MTSKFKALGLALIAVLAISAAIAQASQAAAHFGAEGEKYATAVTGKQIEGTITGEKLTAHQFTTSAGTVKCTTATFAGSLTKKGKELTLAPTYSGCTLAGLGATVNMNTCDYLFTAEETVSPGLTDAITVNLHVICPTGKVIEVKSTVNSCVVTISGAAVANAAGAKNQNLVGITAENTTTATPFIDVDATIDVTGIHYTTNGKCLNDGGVPQTKADGKYEGAATIDSPDRGVTVT